jgi:uncharacterized membrane protein
MEATSSALTESPKERTIHRLFEIGILLKGLNALLEFGLGFALFFVNIAATVNVLVARELVEDPTDFLAVHLQALASGISPGAQFYSALYLLGHGIVKGILVAGLLRNKLWAYPASLAVLGLFVLYQVIKFLSTHSIALVILTVFDLIVIWLIWHEYRLVSRARKG